MRKIESTMILGVKVRIQHVPFLSATEGILGDADDDKQLIRLDADLEDAQYKRVLRHEKVHMALRLSGLVELMTDDLEEALCRLFETFRP
jgi:hypothetical protein